MNQNEKALIIACSGDLSQLKIAKIIQLFQEEDEGMKMLKIEYMITKIINLLIIVFFIFVTLILTTSILTRFLQPYMPSGVNIHISWAEEVIKYSVLWICWLGAAIVVREKGHFALKLLTRKYPNMRFFPIILFVATIIMAGLFIYYGTIVCINMRIQKTPSLQISKMYVNMVVPITGILMIFYSLVDLRNSKRK